MSDTADFSRIIPASIAKLGSGQDVIPKIAKNPRTVEELRQILKGLQTEHTLVNADSTRHDLQQHSIHLAVTSPPYWTLKRYREGPGQLGHVEDYEDFLDSLDRVWSRIYEGLVPGGRLVCVVGDVCLSRRKNQGEHTVVPLHASIQERCRKIGFTNLAPIIWHKISNATYEV
ncbi:MAG: site-specific DNA-methyltransferase, partial [Spirochaetales bacterium]|nr:site-specific DNA-methyltransferase [Spirochaetales bacterium]